MNPADSRRQLRVGAAGRICHSSARTPKSLNLPASASHDGVRRFAGSSYTKQGGDPDETPSQFHSLSLLVILYSSLLGTTTKRVCAASNKAGKPQSTRLHTARSRNKKEGPAAPKSSSLIPLVSDATRSTPECDLSLRFSEAIRRRRRPSLFL